MVTLVNLTGEHLVRVVVNGEILEVPYSGNCARVNFQQELVATIEGVDIYRNGVGVVKGLPEPQEGVIYIVSRLLAEYVKRLDVCCPNSSPAHVIRRDEYGCPVAVDSLITYG